MIASFQIVLGRDNRNNLSDDKHQGRVTDTLHIFVCPSYRQRTLQRHEDGLGPHDRLSCIRRVMEPSNGILAARVIRSEVAQPHRRCAQETPVGRELKLI